MLQHILNGQEYTTRPRLLDKYNIAPTNLQMLLTKNNDTLDKVVENNKFYFLKSQIETIVEEYLKTK